MNPIKKSLDKARGEINLPNKAFQQLAKQGVRNKGEGIVIKTNPNRTAKGNTTCPACLEAKRTGAPLPPQHPNCRCRIERNGRPVSKGMIYK